MDTSAFESAVAADAASPDAEAPDAETPDTNTPDAATPDQTVDPDALDAGDAAAAGAVAAGAAGVVGLHAGASGGKAPSTPTSPTGPASPATPSAPSSNAPSSPTSNTPSSPTPDANTPAPPGTPDATSPDANTPETPETPEGSNSTERTTAEIDSALAEINPNFDPFDPANGYATNCGNTSAILNDFLNGNPSSEAPTGTLGVPEMEARTGNPQTPMTPDQIADSLREMGAGSHCVVGIDRSTGDGHWFNAYFDGDTVWSIDAQTGTRSAWPPNEPNATNWDASIRPEDVADPKTPDADAATPTTNSSTATPTAPAPSPSPSPSGSVPDSSTPDLPAPETAHSPETAGADSPTTDSVPDHSATDRSDANDTTSGDRTGSATNAPTGVDAPSVDRTVGQSISSHGVGAVDPGTYSSGDSRFPGTHPPVTPLPGSDGGGSGEWHATPARYQFGDWPGYQEQVSGAVRAPDGTIIEYRMWSESHGRYVEFDGHTLRGDPPVEVFLEAKFGYAHVADAESFLARIDTPKFETELRAQLDALPDGARLEWHFSDFDVAAAVREYFSDRRIRGVDVVYTPQV